MVTQRPIEILLVEDNPGDVLLTTKAFKKCKLLNTIHVATDGEEALQFVRKEAPHQNAPRPDLILLDMNLPKISGADVLKVIKADPDLRRIPVIMLTSSDREADIHRAYEDHVNSYITKPPTFDALTEVIMNLETYWFVIVKRST